MSLTNASPFIAGNWKMHKTPSESADLARELIRESRDLPGAEMVVIPPFTSLQPLGALLGDTPVQLGAQNMHWEDQGAFTGEISPIMLRDAGCTYVVIGHSERRQYFGEIDETVNRKVRAALAHDLFPILCLGETLEEREAERTLLKIESQLKGGLEGIDDADMSRVIIAYEPIWAIGTGRTATPAQAQEIHAFIRDWLAQNYGKNCAGCAIILYGGSVKPANAFSLLLEKDINGALIGGASLDAKSFTEIAREALKAYGEK